MRRLGPLDDARRVLAAVRGRHRDLMRQIARGDGKRKPPEAGLPVPAIPPRGPLPLQGGAEAALESDFD